MVFSWDRPASFFAYVENTFQCLPNYDPDLLGLYGCATAIYNETRGSYECLKCEDHKLRYFIPVIADKSCINQQTSGLSDKCLEAEKNEGIYSCTKCLSNYARVKDTYTNITNCYERENSLSYCEEGKIENGQFICTKCVNNSHFDSDKNICTCNFDSFSKNKTWCYKCNDDKEGTPGCDL